ncbi:MAG: DUF4430 domain-containing protein [Candidatus Aenigmarchaeota archaeon]|nr:DUF4430 domain-containing protein [Candidatus Aenigmarchaeota archaeon]
MPQLFRQFGDEGRVHYLHPVRVGNVLMQRLLPELDELFGADFIDWLHQTLAADATADDAADDLFTIDLQPGPATVAPVAAAKNKRRLTDATSREQSIASWNKARTAKAAYSTRLAAESAAAAGGQLQPADKHYSHHSIEAASNADAAGFRERDVEQPQPAKPEHYAVPAMLPAAPRKPLVVDYAQQVIGGQRIFERVIFQSDERQSVYQALQKAAQQAGLDLELRYDAFWGSVYVEAINGVRDGAVVADNSQLFWEFYVDGQIGLDSIDKARIGKGSVVEWRLAQETSMGCGAAGQSEYRDLVKMSALWPAAYAVPDIFPAFPVAIGGMRHAYG